MHRVGRLAIVGCLLATGLLGTTRCREPRRDAAVAEAGVWFEPVRFRSAEIGGDLTPADLASIERHARVEIARAFTGLRLRITDRRDTAWRVRVVESVRDPRFRSHVEVAGASWGMSGVRGHGAVSFRLLASGALANTPSDAPRDEKLATIGRGIGRSVVHELVHQFFPSEPMHSDDAGSFEFPSAARPAQYHGEMHWGPAWPRLQARFGAGAAPPAP